MKANILTSLSVEQLKRALELREQIETLESELSSILGDAPVAPVAPASALTVTKYAPKAVASSNGKRVMSAEWRAKIAAAQSRRWAKARAEKAGKSTPSIGAVKPMFQPLASKTTAPKRIMSAEWKAKIAAAQSRRWAKARADKAAKASPVKPMFQPLANKPASGKKVMSAETKAKIGAAIRAKHANKRASR